MSSLSPSCSVTGDCIKLLKSECLEVDALKSESKGAIKELAEVQSELLQSKRNQIEYFQNGVQSMIKTEFKSYTLLGIITAGLFTTGEYVVR